MTILPETLGERADIYQIVRFENDESRIEYSVVVYVYIQEVELCMLPKEFACFCKLLVELGDIVAHP